MVNIADMLFIDNVPTDVPKTHWTELLMFRAEITLSVIADSIADCVIYDLP